MTAVTPDLSATSRRSFVYRVLAGEGAAFEDIAGAAVATGFGDEIETEIAAARSMGLADLSPLPRSGFKGRGALAWLEAQGVTGIDEDNKASLQADGSLAARLAPTEALDIVRGSTIRAKHVGKDILAGLRTLVGGEIKEYTEMISESRVEAQRRMIAQAEKLRADAVINVRYVTSQVMAGAAELLAYGTAVKLR